MKVTAGAAILRPGARRHDPEDGAYHYSTKPSCDSIGAITSANAPHSSFFISNCIAQLNTGFTMQ
jgi:hypothetical protein